MVYNQLAEFIRDIGLLSSFLRCLWFWYGVMLASWNEFLPLLVLEKFMKDWCSFESMVGLA